MTVLASVLMGLTLASCATHGKQKELDETLQQYEAIIRWSEWDGAVNYIHPDYLKENPITNLDMERLRLFRVTNYAVRSGQPLEDGNRFTQGVAISMFNKTRAVEKVVFDQQDWKYDEEAQRWLLHSGLPDVTTRR
jgi:hypothetical protein